jgi:uncharacterized peroxidase-related enzyme
MSAWIEMIPESEATGVLREMYDGATTPHGTVDNVMKAHSLRPHTMAGHVALYRSVLHHPDITLPLWFLEVIASYTSIKNNCEYSLTHHFMNARRLMKDEQRADDVFSGKELALLIYAGKLTESVGSMEKSDYDALRSEDCNDGEILEVNQVVAYFNYSNRLLNGLGVTTEGDAVGYYK